MKAPLTWRADPDFHRRDIWNAINRGAFPEWELSAQLFDDKFAEEFDFDVLDATKLIPEEIVPLRPVGKMVLNRNVDNFLRKPNRLRFSSETWFLELISATIPCFKGAFFLIWTHS